MENINYKLLHLKNDNIYLHFPFYINIIKSAILSYFNACLNEAIKLAFAFPTLKLPAREIIWLICFKFSICY